jgi:predicted HicB family RNase H-like nuclease
MTNLERLNAYSVEIIHVEEEGFVAHYRELGQAATGHGLTTAEALEDLRLASLDLAETVEEEFPAPAAIPAWSTSSGRVTLRLPKSLHYQLGHLAQQEGVSLNGLLVDILRSGATALASGNTVPFAREWFHAQ